MSYRSNRFNGSMRSLDKLINKFGESNKIRALSDNGAGASRMYKALDTTPESIEREEAKYQNERRKRLHAAEVRLYRAKLGYLVPTLRLIVQNGENRKESIWILMNAIKKRGKQLSEHIFHTVKNY